MGATLRTRVTSTPPTETGTITLVGAVLENSDVDQNFLSLNAVKMDKAANLSDLASAATARTNLGLGNVTNESKTTMFTSPTLTVSTWVQAASTPYLDIGTPDTKKQLRLQYEGATNVASIGIEDGYAVGALTFRNNAAERMRIDKDGHVGIGTTTCQLVGLTRELTVSSGLGANTTAGINIQGSRSTGGLTVGGLAYFSDTTRVASINTLRGTNVNDGILAFYTANAGTLTERVRITNTGQANFYSPDATVQWLLSGTTKGVRMFTTSAGSGIEGVDNSGVTTYQPITLGGSFINFTIGGNEAMRVDAARSVRFSKSAYFESQYTHSVTSGALTGASKIDFANGQKQKLTLTGNVTGMDVPGFPGVGHYQLFLVSSSYSVTWPTSGASWQWLNATGAPALNTGTYGGVVNIYYDGTIAIASYAKVGAA